MSIEKTLTAIADAVKNGTQAVIGLSASINRYCDIIERQPPANSVVVETSSESAPVEADDSKTVEAESEATETAPVESDETDDVTYTYDEHVKPAVLDAVKLHGKDVVLGKMQDMFGCQKAPEIPAERYGEWLDALKDLDVQEA